MTGRGRYVDDTGPRPALQLAFVRSPYPHARIVSIETAEARDVAGVVEVLTGADLDTLKPPPAMILPPDALVARHAVVPADHVVFEGEVVAAVAAIDAYTAADAAEMVEVRYEELPAVGDPLRALDPEGPLVHAELGTNVAFRLQRGTDEAEAALATSELVAHVRVHSQRLAAVPMETPGIVAEYDALAEGLFLHVGTQRPQSAREVFAHCLGLPEQKIRVSTQDMGGSFGARSTPYPEELIAAYLAWRHRTTVCWSATRRESLRSMTQGRGFDLELTIGLTRDGTLTALDVRAVADMGATLHSAAAGPPMNVVSMAPGPYRIPVARARVTAVHTNRTFIAPYRGAGRPEAVLGLERVMDQAARVAGIDPAELRRRNFLPPEVFPYTTPTGLTYDSGNYAPAFERALELAGYSHWRQEQQRARQHGRFIGLGICSFVEPAGSMFWEHGEVQVDGQGKARLLTGTGPHGQGHQTTFAQVVADELGVPIEDVLVLHGDTALIPQGGGTFGSRSAALGGSAALLAARGVKEKMKRVAGNLMEVPADDVLLEDGRFHVAGVPARGLTFREVAEAAHAGRGLDPDMGPGLEAGGPFTAKGQVFPFGTHVAVVEVHEGSGVVEILRYVGVDDCGNVINPLLVEGQVLGGLAQGIGQALSEEVAYDADGHLLSTSLMDYAVPKAGQIPRIELDHTVTPSPLNPLGAKGVGEAGAIAAPPAILNAVLDALAPLGIDDLQMPLTPPRVWAAIQRARAGPVVGEEA